MQRAVVVGGRHPDDLARTVAPRGQSVACRLPGPHARFIPMRIFPSVRPIIALAAAVAATLAASADQPAAKDSRPFLSPIFGDNMVLQRGKPNRFWGWANPGEKVRVEIAGRAADAVAAADGKWGATLEVPQSGGPYAVEVSGPRRIELRNVLVGDVWLCGGQSNMNLGVGAANNGQEEIKSADHPDLRLYIVGQKVAYSPVAAPAGSWKVCSPATLAEGGPGGFSAAAYYFARRIQADVHVPIGLIEDCSGGSPAEAWMSGESLSGMGEFAPQVAAIGKLGAAGGPQHGSFLMHWLDEYDPGAKGDGWEAPGLDVSRWKPVELPGAFAELGVGSIPSVCWFRREISLPDPLPA